MRDRILTAICWAFIVACIILGAMAMRTILWVAA